MATRHLASEEDLTERDPDRSGGLLYWLIALATALVSLTGMGSILGDHTRSPVWMLFGAALICFGAPAALALWLRRLAAPSGRSPRLATLLLAFNGLLLVVLVWLAGERTANALRARGDFWVVLAADVFDLGSDSALRRAGTSATRWLAEAIPTHARREPELGRRAAGQSTGSAELGHDQALPAKPAPAGEAETRDENLDESPREQGASTGVTSPGSEEHGTQTTGHPSTLEPGATRVEFERHGRAILVPVRLHGPGLHVDVQMLFDTGATLTTVDSRTLANLGLYVSASDPTLTLQTASGAAQRTITVIEGAEIGGARVDGGLAVAVCDECSDGDVVGLLGLNYARHFRVTVDHGAGELQLERKSPGPDQLYDIRPFVRLTDIKGVQRGEELKIQLWLENRSPRTLRDVQLSAEAGGTPPVRLAQHLAEVAPGRVRVEIAGHVPTSANGFRVEVDRASWSPHGR